MIKDIDVETWDTALVDELTLVYFWAEWCQPCKLVKPVIERLAEEHPQLTIAKVNADDNQELLQTHKITSIPTFLLYKEGELVWTLTGAKPYPVFAEKLEPYV